MTAAAAVQVLLHMLSDQSAHDSTACMAAILSMGRRGAWPLAEQLLLAAFGPRYNLERISVMHPASLSQVPDSFHEVRSRLTRASPSSTTLEPAPPETGESLLLTPTGAATVNDVLCRRVLRQACLPLCLVQ